jgi:hypothetical protein
MGRACSTNGEKRNSYRLLFGKPEEKRALGRQRHRRVDNIKMDFGEIECSGMNWIGVLLEHLKAFGLHKMFENSRVDARHLQKGSV